MLGATSSWKGVVTTAAMWGIFILSLGGRGGNKSLPGQLRKPPRIQIVPLLRPVHGIIGAYSTIATKRMQIQNMLCRQRMRIWTPS